MYSCFKSDLYYVKVGKTRDWDKVYAYCDYELVKGAVEASVDLNYVKYMDKRGRLQTKYGKVHIMYHNEKERPVEINLEDDIEQVYCGQMNVTKLLKVAGNYTKRF